MPLGLELTGARSSAPRTARSIPRKANRSHATVDRFHQIRPRRRGLAPSILRPLSGIMGRASCCQGAGSTTAIACSRVPHQARGGIDSEDGFPGSLARGVGSAV
jgi:hypothetical protein